jgi:probable HAF family extracellular repeat protein
MIPGASPFRLAFAAAAGFLVGCAQSTDAPSIAAPTSASLARSTTVAVTAASPAQAPLETTLDVQVTGSGFDNGSRAEWLRAGNPDPRVRTNSTRFVSSTSLVANITIASDAVPTRYDVAVTTTSGKKGIGTELFTVLPMQELSSPPGSSNANDVNSTGTIAGGRAGGCDTGLYPVIWRGGGEPVDLPVIAPWCNGTANFINEGEVMVGRLNLRGTQMAVRWVPDASQPSGYSVAEMGALPDGSSPDVKGLNDGGYAIANHNGAPGSRGYWWNESTGWSQLAMPAGATQCYAEAINNAGEISGMCTVGGVSSAAFWSSVSATPELLPRLSGYTQSHSALALNNNGVAVGYAGKLSKSGSLTQTGVRWTRSGTTWTIDVLPDFGRGGTQTWDVNDAGSITGASWVGTSKNHAFLLVPGQSIRDLGSLGTESWGFAVSPSNAGSAMVVGVSSVGTVKRATLWRP